MYISVCIYIYMCTDAVGRPLGVVSMWDLPILFCVPGVWDPERIHPYGCTHGEALSPKA